MKFGHCSTNIKSTRDIKVIVLKAPSITMTIDSEPVTDGATKSYEEGAQLELRCEAEGGVPDEIRSYTDGQCDKFSTRQQVRRPHRHISILLSKSQHRTEMGTFI